MARGATVGIEGLCYAHTNAPRCGLFRQVEDLENGGQAINKLLLQERSTCEEIRRRLKGEKVHTYVEHQCRMEG